MDRSIDRSIGWVAFVVADRSFGRMHIHTRFVRQDSASVMMTRQSLYWNLGMDDVGREVAGTAACRWVADGWESIVSGHYDLFGCRECMYVCVVVGGFYRFRTVPEASTDIRRNGTRIKNCLRSDKLTPPTQNNSLQTDNFKTKRNDQSCHPVSGRYGTSLSQNIEKKVQCPSKRKIEASRTKNRRHSKNQQ